MIAPKNDAKTIRFQIKRQDNPDSAPYWDEFEVPYKPNLNVISCLQWIAEHPVTTAGRQTTPVVWDSCCLEEVCGACTMLINGKTRQSCSALIDQLLEEGPVIKLEPMTKFPVVRDLFVDRQRMFDLLKNAQCWVPIDGTHSLGFGPAESPDEQETRYALSRCMTCGNCLEACPQFQRDNDFQGPQVWSQIRYFNLHPTGAVLQDQRLSFAEQPGGITDCGNAQNCVKVCPKEIPLTETIGAIGRAATLHSLRKFFSGR